MSQPPQDRPQGQPPSGQGPQQPHPQQGPQGRPQQGPPQQGPGQPPQGQPGRPPQQGPQGYPGQGPQGYPGQGAPGGYPPRGYPPQQGYPQQGPANAPYGPGPQGGGYGPGGPPPYGQPPQAEGPKKRTGLLVLIGAGALALILAVIAVAVNVGGGSDTADGGPTRAASGPASDPGGSAAPAASASDAVSGFLAALVQQDADRALSYAAEPVTDRRLMTPEVLATSAKLAPIGNVAVPAVTDKDATSVAATYTLGSTPVSATFDVVKVGDAWRLKQVAAPVDVSGALDGSVPMLVNGVRVKDGSLNLLPGAYRFTTGQRNYDYGSRPDVLVQSPSDYPDASRLTPGISKAGKASALKAVRKSWSSCLKSKDPKPGACPNRWTGKYSFKKGTVKWTRKGSDPVKKPKSYASSSAITYQVKVDLQLKGRCTYKGQSGTCTGSLSGTSLARADVSAKKVKVRWQV